jgi:hypothetical protein
MEVSLNKKINEAEQRFLKRVEELRSDYRFEIKRITQAIEKRKLETLRKSLQDIQ